MTALRALAAALALAWSGAALADHSAHAVHLLLTDFAGKVFDYRIAIERAKSLPDWEPQTGKPPPLRGDRAVATALDWMKKRAPEVERFAVFRIELSRVTYINRGVLWHYTVYADAVHGTRRIPALGMQAVVLLDGTVVEPIAD